MGTDRTWTLARRSGDGAAPWHAVSTLEGENLIDRGWEAVRVVEESRLREAEAERDNARAAAEHAREWNAEMAKRAEKAEAELREAREALRAFFAISPGPLDTQTGIIGRPSEKQVDEYRQRATKVADDLRIARDRARGVLEKGDKS